MATQAVLTPTLKVSPVESNGLPQSGAGRQGEKSIAALKPLPTLTCRDIEDDVCRRLAHEGQSWECCPEAPPGQARGPIQ